MESLPTLSQTARLSKQTVIDFKGLNKNPVIEEGELSNMRNLSSKDYPCLSPRGQREIMKQLTNGSNVISFGDKLFYIADNKFYYNGVEKGSVTPGNKQLAVINDYVVIFPDKIHYDSVEDKFANMEIELVEQGPAFTDKTITIVNGDFITAGFKIGDGITISGAATHPANNRSVVIQAVEAKKITVGSNVLEASDKTQEQGNVSFKRTVPDMDFIIECNNRLWGCKDNKMIYCSMQGSHTNFNVFSGLVTDSYFVEVGSAGDFTGAMAYNNYPYFFKEGCIHKIYGFSPSQFQVITMNVQGVKKGCEKSLSVTNNYMFYVARDGVMIFDTTTPTLISDKLRYIKYDEAVAGGNRKFYYVCLRKGEEWEMLCYDSDIGLWHKQDNTHALSFDNYNGELIYLDSNGNLIRIDSDNSEEVVRWEATTGDINSFYEDKKGIVKLKLRIELEANSDLSVLISYDNGPFKAVKTFQSYMKETKIIPLQPQRCNYFKIKLIGTGEAKVYSVIKEFYQSSEV